MVATSTAARRPRGRGGSRTSVEAADAEVVPPEVTAKEAGLRYSVDGRPGITRRRAGKGFAYRDAEGGTIRDPATLERIRKLAIPPAWTEVWINPDPRGHLQATGRDAKGRKQYRYHERFRETRDEAKFGRMIAFADALPGIRKAGDADLGQGGLPRTKVLAAVVRLLELTLIRVGNEEYARLNDSFGLTTLQDKHARVRGTELRFRFAGKSGKVHEVELRDRRLSRIIDRCQDLPGQDLLQYVDPDGQVRDVRSEDVNDYLREISGQPFTAKDFRTWAGTVLAYRALRALQPEGAQRTKKAIVEAIKVTADHLGNTPAVARKSYVHPAVLEAYLDGSIGDALVEAAEEQVQPPTRTTEDEEHAVVELLQARQALAAGSDTRASPSRRRRSARAASTAA